MKNLPPTIQCFFIYLQRPQVELLPARKSSSYHRWQETEKTKRKDAETQRRKKTKRFSCAFVSLRLCVRLFIFLFQSSGRWLLTALLLTACQLTIVDRRPLAIPVTGAPGLGDSLFPALGNGGYDAQHYTLDLSVDVTRNFITGTATMLATATQPLRSFNLDLAGLEVAAVSVNGLSAPFARAQNELTITPTTALAVNLPFTVSVNYHGTPIPIRDPSVPFATGIGWLAYEKGSYVMSEPSGAMSWYPVNNHPTDKATYTFRIRVPKPYVVAANGQPATPVEQGEQMLYVWQMAQPMASYLATVNIAEYTVVTDEGPNGLPLYYYLPPESSKELTHILRPTAAMIDYYSQLIGPFPFTSYGGVVVSSNFPGALEAQGMVVYSRGSLVEVAMAHELAHQWFGDSVSPARWQDIWLNEGFATYFEKLWLEKNKGRKILKATMRGLYQTLAARHTPAPGNPTAQELFGPGVYLRGAWALHALRIQVGDEQFFAILRAYYARYRDRNASTEDFIAVAEQISGQPLADFFAGWLYAAKMPPEPRWENEP